MEAKTKKILIGSGIALLVTIGIIVGYKQYKKMTTTHRLDVALLTPEQRKALQDKGIAIPATGSVLVKTSEISPGQLAKMVSSGRG